MTIQELHDFSNLVQLAACLSFEKKKPSVKCETLSRYIKPKLSITLGFPLDKWKSFFRLDNGGRE